MTIFNLGSINADHFYQVPHLPMPGETIAASDSSTGLGGKGANQSVAAARMGARVVHIGAVGEDGQWAVDRLTGYGVETGAIAKVAAPTAHAIINVAPDGENAIVIFSGANIEQDAAHIEQVLRNAQQGDLLLLQNETNAQVEAAKLARARDMTVIYSAAPFSVDAVSAMLGHCDMLVVNEVEHRQLQQALGDVAEDLPEMLITRGAEGAEWRGGSPEKTLFQPAFKVTPVDTTGAGDTFIGAFAAGLDLGLSVDMALRLAAGASALKVTRRGTADAIPSRDEVEGFLANQG